MLKAILIDDEKWNRTLIRNLGKWSELGIELVGEAEDGEEGIRLIEQFNPHIVITDMQMPGSDGVDLLKSMLAKNMQSKIIVISGHDDFVYMKQAIQSQAFEYLLKPVEAADLNRVLSECAKTILLDRKNDTLHIFSELDNSTRSEFHSRLKLVAEFIQNNSWPDAIQLLLSIGDLLKKSDITSEVISRIVAEHMTVLLHEKILMPAGYPELATARLFEIRSKIEQGIVYSDFLYMLSQIADVCFEQIRINLQKNKRSVAELAEDYIAEYFRSNISLDSVASHFFVSKEYLGTLFKQLTGESIGKRILKLKMEDADRLLRQGMSHQDVARILNFQDKTYFYKVFKKYYGKTPSEHLQGS